MVALLQFDEDFCSRATEENLNLHDVGGRKTLPRAIFTS